MKSERLVLGVVLALLVGFCSYSYVSAEEILLEELSASNITVMSNTDEDSVQTDEDDKDDSEDDKDENIDDIEPTLLIKAVNAGGVDNANEMIELVNLSDHAILLTGFSIQYENSTGKLYSIYEFSDGSEMVDTSLLLRLASSENAEKSDLTYSKDLSQSGGKILIVANGGIIDSVCWGNISNCENKKFDSKKPTILVRDLETFKFSHVENYNPEWIENRVVLNIPQNEEEALEPVCYDLEFSELYSYVENDTEKQFIEFFNSGAENIVIDGCYLEYKSDIYTLFGEIESGEYFVYYPDFSLTKNPTSSNTIILHDKDDSEIDSLIYSNGQKKGASFAKFTNNNDLTDMWQQTFNPTPGSENIYQKFRTCENGKILNETTGKCVIDSNKEEEEKEDILPVCKGLQFSEIFSYYESDKSEQFVEFFNPTTEKIELKGCEIRYKNKLYALNGFVMPESYFTFYPSSFSLTKNPTSSNKIEIIDADNSIVDTLIYYNGQKKGVSYAQFGIDSNGAEIWDQTYLPTPGEENDFQRFKTCEAGKVINEDTGNCVKITTVTTALSECPAGSYRNPLTNRCKKYSTTTTTSSLKECAEGYERNPETNRCRKIVNNDGADYEIKTEDYEENSSFVAIWAIAAVAILGGLYIIFEYREEILKIVKKKHS